MKTLHTIAVNIDGVILVDTFSPVIKELVLGYNGVYDRDLERNVFSQGQKEAAQYIIKRFGLSITIEEVIQEYFQKRKKYLETHPSGFNTGFPSFIQRLSTLNVPLLCYGGLSVDYFHQEIGEYSRFFTQYVCTDKFRPGVKEIIYDYLHLLPKQVLFIDDVFRVAESALALGTGFIGMPASTSWGFQEQEMRDAGIQNIVHSLDDITLPLIKHIDESLYLCQQ